MFFQQLCGYGIRKNSSLMKQDSIRILTSLFKSKPYCKCFRRNGSFRLYIYIYKKQVKQESRLTPSKGDHKMRCILEALQVYKYKSKK